MFSLLTLECCFQLLVGEFLFNLQGPLQMPLPTKAQSICTLPENCHVYTFSLHVNSLTAQRSTPNNTAAQPSGRMGWMGRRSLRQHTSDSSMPKSFSKEGGEPFSTSSTSPLGAWLGASWPPPPRGLTPPHAQVSLFLLIWAVSAGRHTGPS